MSDMVELVYRELKEQLNTVQTQLDRNRRVERAEQADSIPASTLALAPLAASGGLGTGVSYITLRWISNGRRPTQGAGLGTGVLAFYESSSDTWRNIHDYAAVTV